MSRVLWHARHTDTELAGSERAWLHHLAEGPAIAAWGLDRHGVVGMLDRIAPIMDAIPEPDPGEFSANYLHVAYRAARAAQDTHSRPWEATRSFLNSLSLNLRVHPPDIIIAGRRLHLDDVNMNTAITAGSDPIRLAAKIHGWCEVHCYIENGDKPWLADLIGTGLDTGLYRPDAGWEAIQAMLRDGRSSPVALSYTVGDHFPEVFEHPDAPVWPDGVKRSWKALTDVQREERRAWEKRFYEMQEADAGMVFDAGMDWLREHRPWARLSPETLGTVTFGPAVSVYDLFAPDRDERIARACGTGAVGTTTEAVAADVSGERG